MKKSPQKKFGENLSRFYKKSQSEKKSFSDFLKSQRNKKSLPAT